MKPTETQSQTGPDEANASVIGEATRPDGSAARGIAPRLLLEQVRNTTPWLFQDSLTGDPEAQRRVEQGLHLRLIREFNPRISQSEAAPSGDDTAGLTALEYFQLALAAHWTTVATFVPTDVDIHIRYKLWLPSMADLETQRAMARQVLATREWDTRALSMRWVKGPTSGKILSGHDGEWFSVAAAAYGALRKTDAELAAEIASVILEEVQKQADVFEESLKVRDAILMLKTCALIAHNLGDLDRVIDQWHLHDEDPLKVAVYKAGHDENLSEKRFRGLLARAGRLNKSMMAAENHRHLALRKPRALRRRPEFIIGLGPFFDDWGKSLAQHPDLTPEEIGEIAEALMDGHARTPGQVGYSRALAGLGEGFPGDLKRLAEYLPAKHARALKAGDLRTLITVPRRRFEEQWEHKAWKTLKT